MDLKFGCNACSFLGNELLEYILLHTIPFFLVKINLIFFKLKYYLFSPLKQNKQTNKK